MAHIPTSTTDAHPSMTRREALVLTGAAVASATLFTPHIARAAAPFTIPPLPYAEDALVPTISARTVGLHYGKHSKGYYAKVNQLAAGKPYADMTLPEIVVASRKARRLSAGSVRRASDSFRLSLGSLSASKPR